MRAGLFLEALASVHEVSLLVVPVAGPVPGEGLPSFVARHAARTVILDPAASVDSHLALIARIADPAAREEALRAYPRPLLAGAATPGAVRYAADQLAGIPFDLVHVMRLYMAPFAVPWLQASGGTRRPRSIMDLDDDEVRTRRALMTLHELRGESLAARRETREAERYATFEREHLPRFDRVLVAAPGDRAAIEARLGLGTVAVVPNAVRVPELAARPRLAAWRLLFVGSLAYPPNADAALVLCREVLPRIRDGTGEPVEVEIVGSRPPPEVVRVTELPGVRLWANVPSVTPYYERARLVVAPIRAGGGTRLKLLEAFAHRCPVVTTRAGAEGLDVEDGVHLLLADGPERMAEACRRLLRDDALVERLAEAALRLVSTRYAVPIGVDRIARLSQALLGD